jgi:hypothetical protein
LFAAANGSGADKESSSYSDGLIALAKHCDEVGLKEQAEITRSWIVPRHDGRHYLYLPGNTASAFPKPSAVAIIKDWQDKFVALRREQAAELFKAAKAASDAGQPSRAYQLLHEVIHEDSEHPQARRILGYTKSARGEWVLPEAEKMVAQPGRLDHATLGWRARTYWRLETLHFQIVTNHSPHEALELGRQLENLDALWRQIFFRYWSSPEALAARFAGRDEPLAPERPKMQVVLFKNSNEYQKQLAPAEPQIGVTLGIYLHKQRTSFFYAGDTSVYPTWYHEATHQLFQESVPGATGDPGLERNFGVLEGAALYMESLADHGSYWTAGGCESDRLQFARYRTLSGDFAMPLANLTALSREKVQKHPEIRKLYAQAAGYTHFLIDGNDGKYREPFVDLLTAIYQGTDAADTLAKRTGQDLAVLDQEYKSFLNVTDDDLAAIPSPGRIRDLSLGQTSVTDRGLATLSGYKALQWLDLSATQISDAGLKQLAAANGLKNLFLERAKITDASLPLIGSFKQLEVLDLSHLAVTDEGLAPLAGLRGLKSLYLSGSPITDAALVHLRGLKQLETLDTEGTKITAEGLKRLAAVLPKLKTSTSSSSQP